MKLQRLNRVPVGSTAGSLPIKCCAEGCQAQERYDVAQDVPWYHDTEQELHFLCPGHSMLEDLDPEDPRNRSVLQGVPVRSNLAFQDIGSLGELMTVTQHSDRIIDRRNMGPKDMWLSLPSGVGRPPRYIYVRPTEKLEQVVAGMLYGTELPFDQHFYVQVNKYRDDEYLVSIKYQQIIGSRYVCRVSRQILDSFLDTVV